MRRFVPGVVLVSLVAAACGTSSPPAPSPAAAVDMFPVSVEASNGTVVVERRPVRVVSLSPSATETLYAVGAGPQVVAVDKSSSYPDNAPRTEMSGFQPNVEAIAAQKPDLVVYARDGDDIGAKLAAVDVPALLLPAAKTLDDVYAQIADVGKATGHAEAASALVAKMKRDIASLTRDLDATAGKTYYHEVTTDLYTVTSATFVGRLYALAELRNIADGVPGVAGDYPKLSPEVIVEADPDLVFLADTKCCNQSLETVAARPGWSAMKAVRNAAVVGLDDDIASRWGPRVVDLLRSIVQGASKERAG